MTEIHKTGGKDDELFYLQAQWLRHSHKVQKM